MRSILESNLRARDICLGKYRYLYGAKGIPYTKENVNKLAKSYPSNFSDSLIKEAMKDADKDFVAIDCSGLVCDVLGIKDIGSAQLYSTSIRRLPVTEDNAREGMVLWRSGHVAYVGEGRKIYEARSTKLDMMISDWGKRAGAFDCLLIVKGSALATLPENKGAKAKLSNPYEEPSGTIFKGCPKGEGVCWVQWELCEAGFIVDIDGSCGPSTEKAIKDFQASCKIEVDGRCGKITRKYLKS